MMQSSTFIHNKSQKRDQAKIRLIKATLSSLMEEGMDGCSVRKISERAGVSTGLINYHYSSFYDLIAAAYTFQADEYLQAATLACSEFDSDPKKQFSAFLSEIFSAHVMHHEVLRAWLVFWALMDSTESIKQAHQVSNSSFTEFLEGLFLALDKQSSMTTSPRLAAIGMNALIDGLWLESCLQPQQFSSEECIQICEQWIVGLLVK